jgi:hypothetical protein
LTLIELATGVLTRLVVPGEATYSTSSWAGPDRVLTLLGNAGPETVAILDVSNAENVRVKTRVWEKGQGPDVIPSCPAYLSKSDRCAFIGRSGDKSAIYAMPVGRRGAAKRLETVPLDTTLTSLVASPDGRYLLFSSDRGKRKVGDHLFKGRGESE